MNFAGGKNKKYLMFLIIAIFIVFLLNRSHIPENIDDPPNRDVLLVDGLTAIDDEFKNIVERMCLENGYNLIIVEDVTVQFFKELEGDYFLIILRLHSTHQSNSTWIFTNEVYKPNKYILEQLAGEVHSARTSYGSETYFVISNYYIEHYLTDSITADSVILMGCNGLEKEDMANAWIKAGSKTYLGWTGDIGLSETDYYTQKILEIYFHEGEVSDIVQKLPSSDFETIESSLLIYSD